MIIEMNIGMAVNGKPAHQLADVIRCVLFYNQNVQAISARIGQSETESTAIVVYEAPDMPTSVASLIIESVSAALRQDCIAAKINGVGYLIGSNAAAWGGVFLSEFWLEY